MFKKNEGASNKADDVQTIIGPSIAVNGDFEGSGDVVVEGKLSGTLKTKRDLRVGPDAKIEADVEAENIFVAGYIKGNIKAREAIEFGEGSIVCGDIETKSLVIERGATFNGSCSMNKEIEKQRNLSTSLKTGKEIEDGKDKMKKKSAEELWDIADDKNEKN